jgi:hypothetical protein
MNKLIMAVSLCVATSAAFAASQNACQGGGVATTITTGMSAGFIKTDFTPKCSANTIVMWEDTAASAAVGGISTKGNEVFTGHTAGGAVSKAGACTASACVANDLTTPFATALAASSS